MGPVIRNYRPADRERVVSITVDSFSHVAIERNIEARFGVIHGRDWKWRKSRQVERELQADPNGTFVAESDGQVVGYITTWSDTDAGIGWIPNLAVSAEWRGKGIGRSLIERALDHFRASGLTHARIETLEQNPIGQSLYPEYGFVEVARQIHYCRDLNSARDTAPGRGTDDGR